MFAAAKKENDYLLLRDSAANSLGNFPQEIYRGTSLPAPLSLFHPFRVYVHKRNETCEQEASKERKKERKRRNAVCT